MIENTIRYTLDAKRCTAFTLLELMVAVGILGMMIAFSSVIFRFSIDAHRVASANAEIMQKLRVITEQLNDDFRGLRKDAPMLIWFEQDNTDDDPNRYDQIMFFADGDFSSAQLYRDHKSNADPIAVQDTNNLSDTMIVKGNVARLYYSLANGYDAAGTTVREPISFDEENRILARRTHILTADPCLVQWPDVDHIDTSFNGMIGDYHINELYEHDIMPLAVWKNDQMIDFFSVAEVCFNRPIVDTRFPNTFHKLMCENAGSFTIQWAYWEEVHTNDWQLRWFPSDDPDNNGKNDDSQLANNGKDSNDEFGAYFNIPHGGLSKDWNEIIDLEYRIGDKFTDEDFFPSAIKFTFRIYDSKGVIEGGRMFTHIVYLNN